MVLDSLIQNLQAQVDCHQRLLAVLEDQSHQTAKTSLVDLELLTSHRDQLTQEIAQLEQGRIKMVSRFIEDHQLSEDANLEALMALAPTAQAKRLKQLKSELVALVEPIHRFAQVTAFKAQARANCFSEVYHSLQQKFMRTSTYSQYGRVNNPKGSVFLTRSV